MNASTPRWTARESWLGVGAWVVLAALTSSALLKQPLRHGGFSAEGWADFTINQAASEYVVDHGDYPVNFVYPLPYVIFQDILGDLPANAGLIIWLVLLEASVLIGPLLALGSLHSTPWRIPIVALLGYWGARYFVDWDLGACNCNLIYVALVCGGVAAMRGERPWLAGALLALSIAMKLYSILFLPYWLWRRRWKAAASVAITLGLLFAPLPAIYLGPRTALDASLGWWEAVRGAGAPETTTTFVAYLVSLHKTMQHLIGPAGIWAQLSDQTVVTWTRALQWLWLATICGLLWRSRHDDGPVRDWRDAAWLLVAVIPLSPLLQPHQGAVLFVASLLIASQACQREATWARRAAMAGLVGFSVLWQELGPVGELRGLGIMVQLIAFAVALAFVEEDAPPPQTRPPRIPTPDPPYAQQTLELVQAK